MVGTGDVVQYPVERKYRSNCKIKKETLQKRGLVRQVCGGFVIITGPGADEYHNRSVEEIKVLRAGEVQA